MTATGWAIAFGGLTALVLIVTLLRVRRRLELVAEASHELRGPVTAIGFAVAALRREPGGIRRVLALETELERMRAGLADLESARSGRRAESRAAPVAVDRLARGAAAGWRPAALCGDRRLHFRWEGGPVRVRADPGRLAQAFGNLLANAVEHGGGPVELHGRREGGRVRVEVRDDGDGAAKPTPVGFTGGGDRGRGLAIAARAVEQSGGTMSIRRQPGGGTVASVELPVADP